MRSPEAMPMPSSSPEEEAKGKPEDKKNHLRIVTVEEAAEDLTHELEDPKDPERWYKMYKKIAPDMTEQAHEIDPKDSARWKAMYEKLAPDMTADTHAVDPKDEARYQAARAALGVPEQAPRQSPPPIPAAAKAPEKKSLWQKVKGIFG